MKKAFVALALGIIAVVFFFGLAPRIFQLEKVQGALIERLSSSLASDVTFQEVYWVWLPLPHLTLGRTQIRGAQFDATVARLSIYPDWRMILDKTRLPGKITLEEPEVRLHDTAFVPGTMALPPSTRVVVAVKNGTLTFTTPEGYRDILLAESLRFSKIDGRITLVPGMASLDIRAASPLGKDISLGGTYGFAEQRYRFTLDWQNIELHKYVSSFFGDRVAPTPSPAGVAGTITGRGLHHLEADLHGTLPCLVVKPQERESPLSCGYADLKLVKDGSRWRIDIEDLELKDPGVNLAGYIERTLAKGGDEDDAGAVEPVWSIDLTGSDLDLASIRGKVLTLWPDNGVARTVCNIVLGGRALSANYRFSGKKADFKRLDAMVIEADILAAPIHVPGAELDLNEAGGPIMIKDSVLTGSSLSGRLGNSRGSNGTLLLDLGGPSDRFRLDLDIEADLVDLPPVLRHLVKHDGFQRQLGKFHNVSGRASGSLHLGDNLHDFKTRFEVKDVQLAARYEPLPGDIVIDSGALQYEPGKVAWQQAAGFLGRQQIAAVSGEVSWKSGEPLLAIEDIRAVLDGASLLAMLQGLEVTRKKSAQAATALDGIIEVTDGSLQGPARQPRSWEYRIDFATANLTLASPLLPETASTEKLAATVTDNEAVIHRADIGFLGQEFSLKGVLNHHLLEDWHGTIEYNGPLKAKLAGWISSRGWFPKKMHPKVPSTMENLKVQWKGQQVAVSGTLLSGLSGGRLPMAKIDYENSPEHLHINELTFYAPGEQGSMGLDFWRLSPHRLSLSWEGFVSAATIAALFQHSTFTEGTLSGVLKVEAIADKPEDSRFEGLLQTKDLRFKTGAGGQPIFIRELDLTGIGSQLQFHTFTIGVDSGTVTGSGQIQAEKAGLNLDIAIGSPFMAKNSFTALLQAFRETQRSFLGDYAEKGEGIHLAQGININGRIGFEFGAFAVSRDAAEALPGQGNTVFTLYDVEGDLQLAPDSATRTEIFGARLCGLHFSGSWHEDTALAKHYHLGTPADETLRLETVLPCLGVKQDIIEGSFSLLADLEKEADIWTGGTIHLQSSQGRILRLKTLANIFKVINITDLFTVQVDSRGKQGFPFSHMDVDMHVKNDRLVFDRAIVRGEGLNLFGRGEVEMDDYDLDMTLLVAPFKTIGTLVSKVPLIGEPLMGEYGSRISIPVALKGPVTEPEVVPLHPEAVGREFFDLVKDTLMLPYTILTEPLQTDDKKNNGGNPPEGQ